MHYRPPGRSELRIEPRQLETTLEADDGIARTERARSVRHSGFAPLAPLRICFPGMFVGRSCAAWGSA
jgi:hypothetical protein